MSSYHLLRAYCVLGSLLYTCDLILTLQNPASRHQFAPFYSEEIEAQMRKWLAQGCTASMWLNWGCNWALFCPWSSSSFHGVWEETLGWDFLKQRIGFLSASPSPACLPPVGAALEQPGISSGQGEMELLRSFWTRLCLWVQFLSESNLCYMPSSD